MVYKTYSTRGGFPDRKAMGQVSRPTYLKKKRNRLKTQISHLISILYPGGDLNPYDVAITGF